MSSKSKDKGKGYERDLAKYLSKLTGYNFERVPSSGAFIGGTNQWRTQKLTETQIAVSEGDLITPDEWKHIRLECKFHKDFSFISMFDNNEKLNEWIEQAKIGTRPLWLLCIKINRLGEFVLLEKSACVNYNFSISSNHMVYGEYIFQRLKKFFEDNKEKLIYK